MLDVFLEVACETEKKAAAKSRIVELMGNLPQGDLIDIANGESPLSKLAFGHDDEWLEKYKGTPLMDQAIALEEEGLQSEMARKQKSQEQRAMYQEEDSQRDELCIKKRMLDLDLAKAESGVGGEAAPPEAPPMGAPPEAAPPAPPPPPAAPPGAAPAPMEAKVGSDPRFDKMIYSAKKVAMIQSIDVWGRQLARRDFDKVADAESDEKKSKKKRLTTGEAVGSVLLGGPGGYLGAKKAREAGESALSGGVRGFGGAQLGGGAGQLGGRALGSRIGRAVGGAKGQLIGTLGGQLAGGIAGGVAGYKALTRKYNKPKEETKEGEGPVSILPVPGPKPEEKQAQQDPRKLTGVESAGAYLGGGIPGYLGAKKARAAGGSALEGGVRGIGGATLGGVGGAGAGAGLGAAIGSLGGAKGRAIGAIAGGGLGAVGGGIAGYKALTKKFSKPKEKKASANLLFLRQRALTKMASGEELSIMEKQAIGALLSAMKGGLAGAGKFLGGAGKNIAKQHASGGASAAMKAGKGLGKSGLKKGTQWAAKNPMAAGGLAAGALGTAALGGAAAG